MSDKEISVFKQIDGDFVEFKFGSYGEYVAVEAATSTFFALIQLALVLIALPFVLIFFGVWLFVLVLALVVVLMGGIPLKLYEKWDDARNLERRQNYPILYMDGLFGTPEEEWVFMRKPKEDGSEADEYVKYVQWAKGKTLEDITNETWGQQREKVSIERGDIGVISPSEIRKVEARNNTWLGYFGLFSVSLVYNLVVGFSFWGVVIILFMFTASMAIRFFGQDPLPEITPNQEQWQAIQEGRLIV